MAVKNYHPLIFRIRALTNLHPGGGDSFYGAVDKLVQRDPATNRPTIHSHSLKGALREYFESGSGMKETDPFIVHVFGSPIGGKANDAKPGNYRFFSADLLALPVPEQDPNAPEAFRLETEEALWTDFFHKQQHLNGKFTTVDDLKKEFQNGISPKFLNAKNFKEAAEELPVIARNQLDNGESKNLWYEELVPHESIFGFMVQADDDLEARTKFAAALNGKVIQVGANATVGYGFCLFSLINQPA